MTQTQVQIEKLRTFKESYDVLSDAVENQLPALDAALHEESQAIQGKIEGLSTAFDDIYAQQLESIIG
mgnify:CR=1 FL=1